MNRKIELLALNFALCILPILVICLFSTILILGLRFGTHGTQWLVPFGIAVICLILGKIELLSAEQFDLRKAVIRACAEDSPISKLCFALIDVLVVIVVALSPLVLFYSLLADYCLVAFDDGLHIVADSREFVFFNHYFGPSVMIPSLIFFIGLALFIAAKLFLLSRKWKTTINQSTDTKAVVHALDKLTTAALFCRKLDKANGYSLRLLQAVEKIK